MTFCHVVDMLKNTSIHVNCQPVYIAMLLSAELLAHLYAPYNIDYQYVIEQILIIPVVLIYQQCKHKHVNQSS